jgi:hypothetical protein
VPRGRMGVLLGGVDGPHLDDHVHQPVE